MQAYFQLLLMTSKTNITKLFNDYLLQFPDEAERCSIFGDYLARTEEANLFSRKNFDGHITTSAFIVKVNAPEILLLRHKSLHKWLQPGGHFEGDPSLMDSALREAEEESGIPRAEMDLYAAFQNPHTPFDIDSHYIPANPKKVEEGHYHHDIRYLFLYTGEGGNTYNEEEATGMKWVKFADLADDAIFGMMMEKIENALDKK